MANVKITDLTALTSPETTDVLPIVDVDTDVTKKVSVGEIVGKISGDVAVGTDGTAAITGGVIVNADVSASAAIAGTKIDPDFGSQTVETTGIINAGSGTAAAPAVTVGTADNGLYSPGVDQVAISTNGTGRLFIDASGKVGLGTSSPSERFELSNGNIKLAGSTSQPFTGFWGTGDNSAFLLPHGFLGSNGSFAVSLYSNGYRDTSSGFTYMGVSGNTTTACGIDLQPNGEIFIRSGTASGTTLPSRMLINSAGNVGIGTTNPGVALHVDGDIRCDGVYGETDTNTSIQFPGSDVITFNKGGSEAARIDSDGRLLIGTSSSSSYGATTGVLQILGTTGAHIALKRTTDNPSQGTFTFAKSRGTVGSETIVNNGDTLGTVRFSGYDGTDYDTNAAEISCLIDGTPGANDMPGRLVFSTNPGSPATGPTERMRIDKDGAITQSMTAGSLATAIYSGSVTDNGASGTATFDVTITLPDVNNYFICEVIGYHPSYTGANEYYRVLATKRTINNTYETSLLENLTSTGSVSDTDTTVTITGRRPRSNTGTGINSVIKVVFRGEVLPTSVTIADS